MNNLIFAFSMAAGDPGGGEDLAAGSVFTARLDVSVAESQLTYRLRFEVLDVGCATQGSGVAMSDADFTGTGTKTGTATWDPPVADRYQVQVLCDNSEGHDGAAGTITIRTNNSITDLVIPDAPGGAAGVVRSLAQAGGLAGRGGLAGVGGGLAA